MYLDNKERWMIWEELLALERLGSETKKDRKKESLTRNSFEIDYDRVVFSDAFRSLQDKTQVVPFSKSDFVHTRLTHSLEVSVVGRSLGRLAGSRIIEQHPELQSKHGYSFNDIGAIVAVACLAHDIGNPPFGHSGESAIGSFFKSEKGKTITKNFSNKERLDLEYFEGNANGFRILARGSILGSQHGIRLTNATLGTFIKYPKDSMQIENPTCVSEKKYGYFQDDEGYFNILIENLGLIKKNHKGLTAYCRHPLTYLTEAADDICYTIIDFEDGINLGWIEEKYTQDLLYKIAEADIKSDVFKMFKTKKEKVGYLRAVGIGVLVKEMADIFISHENQLLKGTLTLPLMDLSKHNNTIKEILNLSREKIYKSPLVIEKIIVGYQAIFNILDKVTVTLANLLEGNLCFHDKLMLDLLPENLFLLNSSTYQNCLNLCTYLSSMSDSNILNLHEKLNGLKY